MITVIVPACTRPDFIPLQKRCFDAFLGPYKWIICEHAPTDELRSEIIGEATVAGAEIVHLRRRTDHDLGANESGPMLQQLWRDVALKQSGIVAIVDSDMWPVRPFDVEAYLGGRHFAGVPDYRGQVWYFWGGLSFANMDTLPNKDALDWNCGKVGNVQCDVGGLLHEWLMSTPTLAWRPIIRSGFINRLNNSMSCFPESAHEGYCDDFEMELFAGSWLHYTRGSGWRWQDGQKEMYHADKTDFVNELLRRTTSGDWKWPPLEESPAFIVNET